MRTQAQMLARKRATRVVSVGLMIAGALTMLATPLKLSGVPSGGSVDHFAVAALWFVAAGAFVGLSRIWGELAERSAPASEKS